MSIATDIRSYADTAVSQGKQMLGQAQAQLHEATGHAGELYGKTRGNVVEIAGKAGGAVHELRSSAEKAVNIDAIKTAVEPYVAQVKDYRGTVTDRAETLLATVKSHERVARFVDTAGTVTGAVVDTVQERVVKPVQSLTGRGAKPVARRAAPAKSSPSAAARSASKPATTKPAATKPAATKPASRPAARKAPARKTTQG